MKIFKFILILLILTLSLSCVSDKYKIRQELKKEFDIMSIHTEVYKHEDGAWKGLKIYESKFETTSLDSIDIYIDVEMKKANLFKEIYINLQK